MDDKRALEQIANCAMCANMCKHSCPTYLATGSETLTPQKKARLVLYERKELIEDEQGFFDVAFQCAMCGACKQHCIYDDYDLRTFVQQARSKAFKQDMLPEETRKRVETFATFGNPKGERQLLEEGTGDTGYLVSCSAYSDTKVLEATKAIISASKEPVRQFGGADICCGGPLYYAGDMEGFEKAARKMKERIEDMKLRKLIVDCPTCVKMMTEVYKETGVDLDVKIVHTVDFLDSLLKEGKLKLGRATGSVTYHDPCILANDMGITAAPREIIRALGYEMREPVYSGNDTHCCGGVRGGKIGDGRVSDKVSSMRIGELKETAADVYVTACPTCKGVLSDVNMKYVTELVSELIVSE